MGGAVFGLGFVGEAVSWRRHLLKSGCWISAAGF